MKKLYRSKNEKIIWGVCGGLGEYFQVDPVLMRILFILLFFAGGAGLFLYIILAIMIPNIQGEEDVKEKELTTHNGIKGFLGLVISLIGLNILFSSVFNINIFNLIDWKVFFAILLILLGVKIIFENEK
ncbi:MAG: PspC domain-containing protein [Candidatus Pacebacteria bacterium]|nr:PspC domain-containing protein [Candidatus Paceibacterota bacterium]MDD4073932.1 PspC domain-containing protein [Candidatus Paceibacterota bacterium]